VLVVTCCLAGGWGQGGFWWMKDGAFSDPNLRSGGYSQDTQGSGGSDGVVSPQPGLSESSQGGAAGNSLPPQGSKQASDSNTFLLPATQGLLETGPQASSCPPVAAAPALSACVGRNSDCWSVGQPDVDCINNALCCFDGCANVCQGEGPRPGIPRPQVNARGQKRKSSPNPAKNQISPPASLAASPNPANTQISPPSSSVTSAAGPGPGEEVQGEGQGLLFPPPELQQGQQDGNTGSEGGYSLGGASPSVSPNIENGQTFTPAAAVASNNNLQGQSRVTQQSQTQRPFIKCPSAMLCVPKGNCDFDGVITKNTIQYTPELEELKGPLIPCINRQRNNMVDVCCRDPDYKETWPQNTGNKKQGSSPITQQQNPIVINNPAFSNQKPKQNKKQANQKQHNFKSNVKTTNINKRPALGYNGKPLNIGNNPFISPNGNKKQNTPIIQKETIITNSNPAVVQQEPLPSKPSRPRKKSNGYGK